MPSDPTPTPPTKRRAALRPTSPRGQTILLAEDEDAVRGFVRIVLEQEGFAVVAAADGRAAGELFDADPFAFHLVLTDVIMPHATGVELAARVRARRPDLPVLFMSGFPGGPDLPPDLLPPGEALLEKPFSMTKLIDTVNAALVVK